MQSFYKFNAIVFIIQFNAFIYLMQSFFSNVLLSYFLWLLRLNFKTTWELVEYFFKSVGFALDTYRQTHEKFLFAGDFNTEDTESVFSEFLTNYDCNN